MSYRGPKGTYDVFPSGREPHERPELWAFVEGEARALGVNALHLEVEAANDRAFGLYTRSGFAGSGRRLLSKRLA